MSRDDHGTEFNLREARRRVGLSQLAAAVAAGVSPSTLAIAERVGLMSPKTAARLAALYGVAPGVLMANLRAIGGVTRARCALPVIHASGNE